MEIKNCSAIVTGGASGMGKATAIRLRKAGAKVAIWDVNKDAVAAIAQEIGALGVICDVTDDKSVASAIEKVNDHQGAARICINCAGIIKAKRMVGQQGPMPLEEFKQVIDVNLIGTFNVMRLTAANMISLNPEGKSEERGIIINTASVAAYEGQIGQTAYSASKGAIVSMTLPAARELAQFGIRVMTIAPGLVDTPMFEKLSPEARASLADMVPFPKRLAYPDEFASLAIHVIENTMLNGEVIRLDGALRMQPK